MKHQVKKEKPDLDQYLLLPIFLILFIFAAVESKAQESASSAIQASGIQTSTLEAESVIPAEAETKKLLVNVGVEYSTNLMAPKNPDLDQSTAIIIQPAYSISDKSSLAARIDLIQNFNDEKRLKTSNTALIYNPISIELAKEFSLDPLIAIVFPTDQESRYLESYRGTLSVRPTISYAPEKIPGLTLSNGVYLSKLFHEFEVKRNFSANNEYSLRNRFIISYKISDKLAVESVNDYVRSWTYNRYQNDAFYFTQKIAFTLKKDWALAFAHKNEGSARGPNNNGDNVEVLNEKTSYVSINLAHDF